MEIKTTEVEEIQKLIAAWDSKHGIGITVEQWHDLRDSVHHQLQKAREELLQQVITKTQIFNASAKSVELWAQAELDQDKK